MLLFLLQRWSGPNYHVARITTWPELPRPTLLAQHHKHHTDITESDVFAQKRRKKKGEDIPVCVLTLPWSHVLWVSVGLLSLSILCTTPASQRERQQTGEVAAQSWLESRTSSTPDALASSRSYDCAATTFFLAFRINSHTCTLAVLAQHHMHIAANVTAVMALAAVEAARGMLAGLAG